MKQLGEPCSRLLKWIKFQTDNPISDFFLFQRWVHFTRILMAFVTTLHLQASDDAALSCKPMRPVTRGGHVPDQRNPHTVFPFALQKNSSKRAKVSFTGDDHICIRIRYIMSDILSDIFISKFYSFDFKK